MENFIKYFNCGKINIQPTAIDFVVSKLEDINNIIIPFFNKYPLVSSKNENFNDFCKVSIMMANKEHLSTEGVNKILIKKSGMNRNRQG